MTSLVVQWLRLCTYKLLQCRGAGFDPGQGTNVPHATGLLSPCETMKIQRSQRKKKKKMRDKQGMMMGKAHHMSCGFGVHWKLGQPQGMWIPGYIWAETVFGGRIWVSEGHAMCRRKETKGARHLLVWLAQHELTTSLLMSKVERKKKWPS